MEEFKAKIKNFEELAVANERIHALAIAESGLQSIDSRNVMARTLKLDGDVIKINDYTYSLKATKRIIFVGVGKCSIEAAEKVEEILGDRLEGGIVVGVKAPENCTLKKIKCFVGTHPFPSDTNIELSKEIVKTLEGLTEDDLVIFVISGGGSTLLCLPSDNRTCVDEKMIVQELFAKGATIQEINTIRKHTSLVRGGYLAKHAYPANVVSLILSDVPGNEIGFVASGPTVKDDTSVADADKIIEKYEILKLCNIEHCGLIETPKEDKYFDKVFNILVASNEIALHSMEKKAKELGYSVSIMNLSMTGEAKEVGVRIAREINNSLPKTVLLYGGETTVTVKGNGKGGRNQEVALAALGQLKKGEVVMSLASDGWDNGEYAGGIADTSVAEKTKESGLDHLEYLNNNDASTFYEKIGDGILKTGYTGSNVSDLMIALKGEN